MSNTKPGLTLVVGATGSIGRLVVAKAIQHGFATRALVRDAAQRSSLPPEVDVVVGELTLPDSLAAAVDGVDAIVFTHGSSGGGKAVAEAVDYGAVHNVLSALGPRTVRIALMTAIGVTYRAGSYNRSTEIHDWKRRGERLVRASGMPYTIVRPGWFDYNDADQNQMVFLQGDTRHAGNSSDGVIAREQIAQVLVESLVAEEAICKTFELVAEAGHAQADLRPLFDALKPDLPDTLDGVADPQDMPLGQEPERVQHDIRSYDEGAPR